MSQVQYCCDEMKSQIEYKCDSHSDKFSCPDSLVYYSEKNKHYGIIVHDGGPSYILINFCPWCGKSI